MIDAHIHAVPDHAPGGKPDGPGESGLDKRPDDLAKIIRAEMKAAGVSIALGMGRIDPPPDDPLGINGTLRLAALIPGLHAIGVADPRKTPAVNPEHFKRAEDQMAAGKVVALKCYLGYLHFGPDDPRYVPYYRLAARYKLPVVFHTGDTFATKAKVRFAHPLLVDDVAVDHPDVRFVMAHFGNPWLMDAAEVIYKNDNVWADLSGILVGDEPHFQLDETGEPPADTLWAMMLPELQRAYTFAEKHDRFLFGTDWPLAPMAGYRRFVESFIPKEHRDLVFEKNARALFDLK
jgi:uncharacterized protein